MMRGIAKYLTLLFLTALAPVTQAASDDDSVYQWGRWENQVQPAAGGVSPQAQVVPQVQVTGNLSPDQSSQFQAGVLPVQEVTGSVTEPGGFDQGLSDVTPENPGTGDQGGGVPPPPPGFSQGLNDVTETNPGTGQQGSGLPPPPPGT